MEKIWANRQEICGTRTWTSANLRDGLPRTGSLLVSRSGYQDEIYSADAYPNSDADKPITPYATKEDLVPLRIGCLLSVERSQSFTIGRGYVYHLQRESLRIGMIRLRVEDPAICGVGQQVSSLSSHQYARTFD